MAKKKPMGRPKADRRGKRMNIYVNKDHVVFCSVLAKKKELNLSRLFNDFLYMYRGMRKP